MMNVVAFLAFTAAAMPSAPSCLQAPIPAQTTPLYCCTLSNGVPCCSQTLDENGKIPGCACSK